MSRICLRWTPAEIEYLRNNYGAVMTKQLAQTLNRAPSAVTSKAGELGILGAWHTQLTQDLPAEADPALLFLRQAPCQPPVPFHSWTAFDTLRLLLLHGVVADSLLATLLQRRESALPTRRMVLRWNRKAALAARNRLLAQPTILAELQALQGNPIIDVPPVLLNLLYPQGLYETYVRRRSPTLDLINLADAPDTIATD